MHHPTANLRPWQCPAVSAVWPGAGVHALHAYYPICPESPDGRRVLVYVSRRPDAHIGDIFSVEHATGRTVVLAAAVEVEDAHRQAVQQWVCGGAFVVCMAWRDGRWEITRLDPQDGTREVLCTDRQLFVGSPGLEEVPLHGPPWAPGRHRNLELLNVRTGAVRTAVELEQVIADHAEAVAGLFGGSRPDSIAYPIVSPDGTRVMFKLAVVRDGGFRSPAGSEREGLFVYDLVARRSLGFYPSWGHPAWMPDSRHILRMHLVIDTDSMEERTIPWYPLRSNSHAAPSPDGRLLAMDVARDAFTGRELHWAVVVGDLGDEWVRLHTDPAPRHGTASWRPAHPHPVFSADGRRIYFNVNLGERTVLHVATATGQEDCGS